MNLSTKDAVQAVGQQRLKSLRLAFSNAADEYERGRAGWPSAVTRVGSVQASAHVLDLGAGTGKLSRVLARRFARVTAVEPSPEMRAVLDRLSNGYRVLAGSAEAIALADESVAAIFCAEAFHWFDWPVALREMERVLQPHGALVLCFAGEATIEPELPDTVEEVLRRYRRPAVIPGGPIIASGAWREPFDNTNFKPLRKRTFQHVQHLDRDGIVALTISQSHFASLPRQRRETLSEELAAAIPEATYRLLARLTCGGRG